MYRKILFLPAVLLVLGVLGATPGFSRTIKPVFVQKKWQLATLKTTLRDFPVSTGRWVVTESVYGKSGGELVDLETQKIVELPWFSTLADFPSITEPAFGADYPTRVAALKMEGKYSRLTTLLWVRLDGAKNTGWIWATMQKTLRLSPDPPLCDDGKPARLIAENQKFYCLSTRSWVDPAKVVKDVTESWLLAVDLAARKVTASTKVADEVLTPVGMDPTETFFVAGTPRIFLEREELKGPVTIYKITLKNQAVQKLQIDMPTRRKTAGVYSVVYVPSPDFSRVFVREADEKKGNTGAGFLTGPTARGHIANLEKQESFEFDAPVEVRTALFSVDHKYLFIDSPALSTVTRLTLSTKTLQRVKTPRPGHFLALSGRSLLYSFHEDGVTIYGPEEFTQLGSMARGLYWPKGALMVGRNLSLLGGKSVLFSFSLPNQPDAPHQILQLELY